MNEYPLHWYVYENDVESLKKCLNTTPKVSNIEALLNEYNKILYLTNVETIE